MRINGAQLTIRLLERQGIHVVAGIPGGAILPLYDALSQSRQIRHVLARHEQGAGFIAQGMARTNGLPAVCLASSGPGVTNLVTAIADAKLDSVPVIAITGQVPRGLIGTDAFQEVDAYGLGIPITKHNYLAGSARELLHIIPRAFEIATEGRPGPVWIDIPKDVQTETIEIDDLPEPRPRAAATPLDEALLGEAADLINAAARPVFYLGGGVVHSPGAAATAVALAEAVHAPTTMTLMALGAMPVDHPLSLGMLGMHGARYTNLVMDECDVLVAIGARFDDRATGNAAEFCRHAKIVHIDIDASELNKIKAAHIAIAGDTDRILAALRARIEKHDRGPWLARVAALKREHPLRMPGADDPCQHYGLIRAVASSVDDDAIITTDVGQHQMWVAQAYPLRRPRRWITSGGLGTMGFGMPAAIGAALAAPNRKVVCFTGDGSLLMNIQELATAADESVNVKIVLMNNNSLGLVHQQQALFYGERFFACRYPRPTDFLAIARGFGVPAVDLDRARDPRETLHQALAADGPALIHVSIGVHAKVFPMVAPGNANREMIGGLS